MELILCLDKRQEESDYLLADGGLRVLDGAHHLEDVVVAALQRSRGGGRRLGDGDRGEAAAELVGIGHGGCGMRGRMGAEERETLLHCATLESGRRGGEKAALLPQPTPTHRVVPPLRSSAGTGSGRDRTGQGEPDRTPEREKDTNATACDCDCDCQPPFPCERQTGLTQVGIRKRDFFFIFNPFLNNILIVI